MLERLLTYWYIIFPLLAIAVYILLANSDSKVEDDDDNEPQPGG